jgi:hypothetical protein
MQRHPQLAAARLCVIVAARQGDSGRRDGGKSAGGEHGGEGAPCGRQTTTVRIVVSDGLHARSLSGVE